MNTNEQPAGASSTKPSLPYVDGKMPIVKYPLDEKRTEELIQRFSYHAPTGDQAPRYGEIRAKILHLAAFISERAPQSRELSTALTHLDAAMFFANAAIARNER